MDTPLNLNSPYESKMMTYRSDASTSKETVELAQDTVHYLSPASTLCPTECEGDLDYQQLTQFAGARMGLPQGNIHDSQSASSVSSSELSCEFDEGLQRTIAIVKPEAMCYKEVVLRAIVNSGLKIVHYRTVYLTPEQVSEIYAKFYGSPAFPNIVVTVSVSPILALSLADVNVVEKWKALVGPYGTLRDEWFFPYSIRTRFGYHPDLTGVLHSSENTYEAKRESRFFFPRDILEPLPLDEVKVGDYISLYVRPILLNGLTELVRVKPVDPLLFLAEWLLLNNPYQPKFPDKTALVAT